MLVVGKTILPFSMCHNLSTFSLKYYIYNNANLCYEWSSTLIIEDIIFLFSFFPCWSATKVFRKVLISGYILLSNGPLLIIVMETFSRLFILFLLFAPRVKKINLDPFLLLYRRKEIKRKNVLNEPLESLIRN
jgi:hypothetical protein